jgi:hypothetical protein
MKSGNQCFIGRLISTLLTDADVSFFFISSPFLLKATEEDLPWLDWNIRF